MFLEKENNKSGGTSETESWEEVDSGILGSLSLPFTIPDDFDFSILGRRNQELCRRWGAKFKSTTSSLMTEVTYEVS